MNCDDVHDLLPLFAGDELPAAEREHVEGHVAVCGACARELDQYREARSALASLREPSVPAGGWRTVWEGVEVQVFPRRDPRRGRWFDEVLRYAALALIGVAIGVAARHAGRPTRPPAERPGATAAFDAGPLRPAHEVGTAVPYEPLRPAPRLPSRPALPSEFHLPRVEAIPAGLEKDF